MTPAEQAVLDLLAVCYTSDTDKVVADVTLRSPGLSADAVRAALVTLSASKWIYHPPVAGQQETWRRRTAAQHAELDAEQTGAQARLL